MIGGSLFSGIGGLELGLEMAEAVDHWAWQAECDPAALAVLAHHWPEVHRYTDVRDVNENSARVDVVCGGFPCQPHSLAGRRRGTADARWLWPEFYRVVKALRPSCVFIENVPGLRTSGLSVVLADLAGLGFDAEWDCFSAAEVGAPHRRRRMFILAYANRDGGWLQPGRRGGTDRTDQAVPGDDGEARPLAYANGEPGHEWRPGNAAQSPGRGNADRGDFGENVVPNSHGGRRITGLARVHARQPDPNGIRWWATEPDVGRVAHGVPARSHRLRLLGNSVVPQQAALAWRTLTARAGATLEAA